MLAPPKPAHDELEALIKEARARQLRRRLFATATVATISALALTISALTNAGGSPSGIASGVPGGAAPPCQGSQLSVSALWDGGGGVLFNWFTITNRGAGACSLPLGRPTAVLTRGGSQLEVEDQAGLDSGSVFGRGRPVTSLAPGQRAVVHLAWSNWCGPQLPSDQTATTVTVRFADGLQATARQLLGEPTCLNAAAPSVLTVSHPRTR